jgi:hypothetical protein
MEIEITNIQFIFSLIKSYFTDFIPSFRFIRDLGLEISKLSLFFSLYCIFFLALYFPFFLFIHYFVIKLGIYTEIQFCRVKKHLESLEAKKITKSTLKESNKQNIILWDE